MIINVSYLFQQQINYLVFLWVKAAPQWLVEAHTGPSPQVQLPGRPRLQYQQNQFPSILKLAHMRLEIC